MTKLPKGKLKDEMICPNCGTEGVDSGITVLEVGDMWEQEQILFCPDGCLDRSGMPLRAGVKREPTKTRKQFFEEILP